MPVSKIVGSDKLSSGFRAKYNITVDEIIVAITIASDGVITFTKNNGGTFTTDLKTTFYTKTEIATLFNIGPATETTAGIVKLATEALVDGELDNTTVITPERLAEYILKQRIRLYTAASDAAMIALPARRGDFCKRTDLTDAIYFLNDDDPTVLADWVVFNSGTVTIPDASPTVKGKMRLYTVTGTGTDGTMDQNSITIAFGNKKDKITPISPFTSAVSDRTFHLSVNAQGDITSIASVSIQIAQSQVTGLATDLSLKEDKANKGIANGYTPLDATGKVAAAYLPSYVDDVIEVANFASLPVTGETGKLYLTLADNKVYRWSGSAYVQIVSSPGSTDAVPEGVLNLYFTTNRVLNTGLSGLVTTTGGVITNSDTVIIAFGKLQNQITSNTTALSNKWGISSAGAVNRVLVQTGTGTAEGNVNLTYDSSGLNVGGLASGGGINASGSNSNGQGLFIKIRNTATGPSSYAIFDMRVGSGNDGGQFFGTNTAGAQVSYGIVDGITMRPGTNVQDIGFSVGANILGSGAGADMIIKYTGLVGIAKLSPAGRLHIGVGSSSLSQFVLDAQASYTGTQDGAIWHDTTLKTLSLYSNSTKKDLLYSVGGIAYITSTAGVPGTPATISGYAAIDVDTTNHILYYYSGGSWRSTQGSFSVANNQILVGNGANTAIGYSGFTYNNSTGRLSIGNGLNVIPASLSVNGTAAASTIVATIENNSLTGDASLILHSTSSGIGNYGYFRQYGSSYSGTFFTTVNRASTLALTASNASGEGKGKLVLWGASQVFLTDDVATNYAWRLDSAGVRLALNNNAGTANTLPFSLLGKITLDANNNFSLASGALATTDANGDTYFATCPGVPTVAPVGKTGLVPRRYDSVGKQWYTYDAAWNAEQLNSLVASTVYVDSTYGNNSKSSSLKYSQLVPYQTADAALATGEENYVFRNGNYVINSLSNTRFYRIHLEKGADLTISSTVAALYLEITGEGSVVINKAINNASAYSTALYVNCRYFSYNPTIDADLFGTNANIDFVIIKCYSFYHTSEFSFINTANISAVDIVVHCDYSNGGVGIGTNTNRPFIKTASTSMAHFRFESDWPANISASTAFHIYGDANSASGTVLDYFIEGKIIFTGNQLIYSYGDDFEAVGDTKTYVINRIGDTIILNDSALRSMYLIQRNGLIVKTKGNVTRIEGANSTASLFPLISVVGVTALEGDIHDWILQWTGSGTGATVRLGDNLTDNGTTTDAYGCFILKGNIYFNKAQLSNPCYGILISSNSGNKLLTYGSAIITGYGAAAKSIYRATNFVITAAFGNLYTLGTDVFPDPGITITSGFGSLVQTANSGINNLIEV